MSFLDKIKAKYDGKLKEDEAAKWTTNRFTKVSSASTAGAAGDGHVVISYVGTAGGVPLGVGPSASGSAWVEEAMLENRCRVLMKKLNITTAAEFDKVFGEIIND